MKRRDSRSGAALLLVLVAIMFVTVVSVEINFISRVEYGIGRNARDRLQASYLAQSAAKFGILRLYMYREIANLKQSGKIAKAAISDEMLEAIWAIPFPPFPPANVDTTWPGSLNMTIESEGSKIPINLLDANIYRNSNTTKADQVKREIKTLMESLLEDEEFYGKYRDLDIDELIENLQDWIDQNSERQKGGDEDSLYDKGESPIFPRNDRIPTLNELYMVSGWNDDLVRRLAPSFSVINTSMKVNPNHIPLQRLKGFWPKLSIEDLQVIQRRRMEAPFPDLKALASFINADPDIKNGRGFKFPENLKSTTEERIFYINAAGQVGDARRSLKVGIRIADEVPPKKPPAKNIGSPLGIAPPPAPEENTLAKDEKNKAPAKMAEPVVITIEESI